MSIRSRRTNQGILLRGLASALALAILIGLPPARQARGQSVPATPSAVTLDQLLQMSPAEIDAIYRQGTATAIPEGAFEARPSCHPEPGEHGRFRVAPGSCGRAR